MTNQTKKLRELQKEILKLLCSEQLRKTIDGKTYSVHEIYKGYYIEDDWKPLFPYVVLEKNLERSKREIKPEMLKLRDEGLVELEPSVNENMEPNGSGWSVTQKGMKYAVNNDLV